MALIAEQPDKDERTQTPRVEGELKGKATVTPSEDPLAAGEKRPREVSPRAESVLGAGLTIEGKIEGTGNLRVSGRVTGNVNLRGDVMIESGAALNGELRADSVVVGGHVRGQLASKSHVELQESATLVGDVKAGSLVVAAGSKMRGRVEFG